jgi:hypothetical protein
MVRNARAPCPLFCHDRVIRLEPSTERNVLRGPHNIPCVSFNQFLPALPCRWLLRRGVLLTFDIFIFLSVHRLKLHVLSSIQSCNTWLQRFFDFHIVGCRSWRHSCGSAISVLLMLSSSLCCRCLGSKGVRFCPHCHKCVVFTEKLANLRDLLR